MARRLGLLALAAICAAQPALGRPLLAVVPFDGKAGKECTRVFVSLAAAQADVRPYAGPPPPRTWRALARWLGTTGRASGAGFVVLGDAGGKDLVLEAYDPARLKLIGLEHAPVGPKCKLAPGDRERVESFVARVLATPEGPSEVVEPPPAETSTAAPPLASDTATTAVVARLVPHFELPPVSLERRKPRDPEAPRVALEAQVDAPLLVLKLELGIGGRSFGYANARSPGLASYDLPASVVAGLALEVRPLAGVPHALSALTVSAHYRRALGLRSREEGGIEVPTVWAEGGMALGYRFEARELRLVLAPHAGYERSSFTLGGKQAQDVPSVDHGSLAFGLGLQIRLRPTIRAFGDATVRAVLGSGQVFGSSFFPRGSAFGFGLTAGAAVDLFPGLAISVAGSYDDYQLSLDAVDGERRVADRAGDARLLLRSGLILEW